MGSTSYSSRGYTDAVKNLHDAGKTFARSKSAAATGVRTIAEILDPRKLNKNTAGIGMRESCYAAGFQDLLPIAIGIDCTGSMDQVPFHIQKELPKMIDLILEKKISDHPNVLFIGFDDERATPPDGCFQMSQFEIGTNELVASLNEMIIPRNGGGNRGEMYHGFFYALARHTRLESFENAGEKGFAFLIEDEEPYYDNEDPTVHGTSIEVAKEVFGDVIQEEVSMLQAIKETAERYHVFILRPGHTSHGTNPKITTAWQNLLQLAGVNSQNVIEVPETDALLSTMIMIIGRSHGFEASEIAQMLKIKGVAAAAPDSMALVPVAAGSLAVGEISEPVDTGLAIAGRERC